MKNYTIDEILREQDERSLRNREQIENEIREIVERNENEKEDENTNIVLSRETNGTKTKGLKEALKSKGKYIATSLGSIAVTAAILLTAKGCSNENKNNNADVVTTTTSITNEITTKPVETTTVKETTKEFTTTTTVAETTKPVETTTVAETTKPVETTTEVITISPDELIVTAPVTTTAKPVEITKPVDTTKPVETTTTVAETTKPVTTTAKAKETTKPVTTTKVEEEQPIEIVPIKIKNLDKKVSLLKDSALIAGYAITDELAINTIRVLHSDYIAHDDFKEITANDYNSVLTLLTNIGSTNTTLMNISYLTGQLELKGKFYVPAEIFPEEYQEYMKEFNKLTDNYVKALNDNQFDLCDLDYEELALQYRNQYQKALDEANKGYGIKDFDEYLKTLEKLVNDSLEDEEERFRLAELAEEKRFKIERTKAYYSYLSESQKLINKEEYKNLASTKLGLLVNVTPVLLSGVETDNYDKVAGKVQNISELITTSVDDIREILVKSNRINNKKINGNKIDQKEVLEAYIKEATERNQEETEIFNSIFDDITKQAEDFVKAR